MSREDVELQLLDHLRNLRLEMASLHAKIDALAAKLDAPTRGDGWDDDADDKDDDDDRE
jgi:hypothetical protein